MPQQPDLIRSRQPTVAVAAPGFFAGMATIPRALGMISRDARLRKLAMRPFLISIMVVTLGLPVALWFSGDLFRMLIPASAQWSGVVETLVRILFTIAFAAICLFILLMLSRIIGAPSNSKLSEGVEEIYTASEVRTDGSLRAVIGESVGSVMTAIGRLLLFLICYPPILATQLIPVAGIIIFPLLSALYGAFALSFDFAEPAYERHLPGFRNRLRFMRRHLPAFLGFGLASVAMMLVPFVNFLLLPVGVAAGTLLYIDCSMRDAGDFVADRGG
jgi:CysZ protein